MQTHLAAGASVSAVGQTLGLDRTTVRRFARAGSLPEAQVAVGHLHLIMLADKAVTVVRPRVTRELLGRPGRKIDPTGQILSAWIAKRGLRALCATAAHGGYCHEAPGVLPVVC